MRPGFKHSEETKRRISESRKGKLLGHPYWGGDGEALRRGREEHAARQRAARPVRNCSKSGCDNTWQVEASSPKRYCSRACAYADKPKMSLEERFWTKVTKAEADKCWLWTGGLTKSGGYGQLQQGRGIGPIRAHRFSYELHIGPVPDDMCVLHRCDTPACVNPSHLFLGSRAENCKDMGHKKRWKNHCAEGENHVHFNGHLAS